MKKEMTVTISESNYDEIIKKLIRAHEKMKCNTEIMMYFIADAIMIRHELFNDN